MREDERTPTREARMRGSLLGLAWGDAFGCPVEGWREALIRRVWGDYAALPEAYPLEALRKAGIPLERLRPLGLHSDDTQQALALLSLCMGEGGFTPEAWGRLLVAGMRKGAWRGYGHHFAAAVERLGQGIPPGAAGSASAGMGAAMRVAPLGALYAEQPEALARVVTESAATTHADLRAVALAYGVAWTVAAFVRGLEVARVRDGLGPAVMEVEVAWLEEHADWRVDRTAGHLVSSTLGELLRHRFGSFREARALVSELAGPALAPGSPGAHPNGGFALLGGAHALVMALWPAETPQALLAELVRQGGDTDTVAAIAGGVLGARFGAEWIPTGRLLDGARLSRWADALASRGPAPESPRECLEAEARWTVREQELLRALTGETP